MIGVLLYLWQPFKSVRVVATPQEGAAETNTETAKQEGATQQGTAKQSGDAANAASNSASNAANNSANSDQTNGKQANAAGDGKSAEQAGTQEKNYEFYDLLPEQEVTPIPDEVVVLEPDASQQNQADVTLKQQKKQQAQAAANDDQGNTETYDGGDVLPEPSDEGASNKKAGNKKAGSEDSATTSKSNTREADDPIETMIAKQGAKPKQSAKSTKATTAKSSQPSTTYILQINSFGNAEDADRRRAEVLLAGVDARVVKTPVSEGEYLYQVISNVYQNKDSVFQDQERLKSSGIDALVVKRKK